MTTPTTLDCPACHRHAGVPLLWGYPGQRALAARTRGLIELGGCMIDEPLPNCHCKACGHRWQSDQVPEVDWGSVDVAEPRPRSVWLRMKQWFVGNF